MTSESRFYLVKVDQMICAQTHDFGWANKKYLEQLKLPSNRKKDVRLLEYSHTKTTTSRHNFIKTATRA